MAKGKNRNSGLVYSTDHGRMCPTCGKPQARCTCSQKKTSSTGTGNVTVGRSTKGRKGKGVTVIAGLPLDHDELRQLAKDLKQKCGSGGTVKEGTIEIQGEHRDLLVEELKKRGYAAKRSGG